MPPGLPSRMLTACFSVQVIDWPAGTTPMKICEPSLLLVSSTQHSSVALILITTSVGFALCVGDGEAEGEGEGEGRPVGWVLVVAATPSPASWPFLLWC